ncbi:nucleotidyltransferase domain-containing protein [Rubrivirga sp. S365]|uniref:nucleotidyltransferase family protein n=1 Tax=Rubrivirga sp. S365 TaxID=3076080 RepID=UPI0028C7B07D|nr:nucleotidyltransferase domain-containing protein [Rubrivirga sp. S365]MDT7858117.1 nucleotidyltransferase domain-containing protein [Rubrivirga sp. S365]
MSPSPPAPPATLPDPAAAVRSYVSAHAGALLARGFASLALFGSAARGEAGPGSDVDVLYAFAPGRASLGAVLDVQDALAAATGRPVQMVPRGHLHPVLRDRVLGGAVTLLGADRDAHAATAS